MTNEKSGGNGTSSFHCYQRSLGGKSDMKILRKLTLGYLFP